MNGKLAWLLGGALIASALMLGGCVADAGDDEQVAEDQAALNDESSSSDHSGLEGVVDTDQGLILVTPTEGGDPGDPVADPSDGCEPEPNPWEPGAPPMETGSGSTPSDPQQQGPQGQMKH